ncbi:MAG: hypothetical protein H6765_10900 [Candidatus Peribacteria bacterium]|nr:MAG: hypothetical protein H6765_10900 [Candidatus Peribacteria bacterium]
MDTAGYFRTIIINTSFLPRGYVDTHDISAETRKKQIVQIEDTSRVALSGALANGIKINVDALQANGANSAAQDARRDQEIREEIRKITFADL